MNFIDAEARTQALVLEDARRRLLKRQGHVLTAMSRISGSTSEGSRRGRALEIEAWMENSRPVEEVVFAAMHASDLPPEDEENHDLARTITASLKMRVLAGTYAIPIYTDDPGEHCGSCARMFYDEEAGSTGSGGDRCKVEGNQELADAWHEAHGFGPSCPFWQRPDKGESLSVSDETIEELFGSKDNEYDERRR